MTSALRHLSRLGRLVREILLSCAALGGVVCIVLAILAFTGGFSLMLFKTGSMSPTIPAGSVALVQKIPAADVRVGDVVTIDRPGTLPITHRVTRIEDGPIPAERVITMRGDANAIDDPLPYTESAVRIVRGSVPGLAPVIVLAGNPWVLGGLTVGTALLVSWAFWPRRSAPQTTAGIPPTPATSIGARHERHERHAHTVLVLIIAGSALAGAAMIVPPPAVAASSHYLVVRSDLEGAGTQRLDRAQPLYWHLDVDATAAPADGDIDVSFSSIGEAELGLHAEVRSCRSPWAIDESCASGDRILYPRGPIPVDGTWRDLWAAPTPVVVYLRIALTAEPADARVTQATASVTVRATAVGETVDTGVEGAPNLPETGGRSLALLAAPAALLVGIGIALIARRRSARENHR